MNRPGGHGRITKLHYSGDGQIESMDVKYTLSGTDKRLAPYLVEPWQELERTHRRAIDGTEGGVDTTTAAPPRVGLERPARRKEVGAGAAAVDEKENAIRQPSRRNHSEQQQQKQPQQPRRRPSIKPLASLKRPTKVPTQAESPQSSSTESAATIPLLIFADDEQSVVSELGMCTWAEEPSPRLSYLTDSSGSGHKRGGAGKLAASRGRLHSLETSDASEFSRRSSPCSKAKSIVSGQLSVVGRSRKGGGGGGAIHSPAAAAAAAGRKVEKRLLATSPSTTKCLAVGQVSSSPFEHGEESRDEHKRSPSQSPRKRRPTSSSRLYVSQLQPVNELACGDNKVRGRMMDRRDDDGDEEDRRSRDRRPADVPEESPLDETMSCTSHDSRRDDFIARLVDLLSDNDGVLDEDCVLDLVNQRAAAECPYSAKTLDESLRHLADQNKIMRSEGHIYLV